MAMCVTTVVFAASVLGDESGGSVRLVDANGVATSSVGLLQIRSGAGFGSVCKLNANAAEVACRQTGSNSRDWVLPS